MANHAHIISHWILNSAVEDIPARTATSIILRSRDESPTTSVGSLSSRAQYSEWSSMPPINTG